MENVKMCYQCQTKPVYEFTNKRKVCKTCYMKWFQKKFLYTIRKFELIKKGDVIGYQKKPDFRSVVLEELLKMYSNNAPVTLVKIAAREAFIKPTKNFKQSSQLSRGKINKIALPDTSDTISSKIIFSIFKSDLSKLNEKPIEGKIIRPLYLFLDKEVLLYAKLKNLKFKIPKNKKDKLENFINQLEQKHQEIKHAIVKSYLKIN